mmetsp:Transcript_5477/g.12605  ORF Transcript_5477/g.12605 Transcript_5477/m.12605 type:complete len:109 (+) Transcript_5477:147-473(+)
MALWKLMKLKKKFCSFLPNVGASCLGLEHDFFSRSKQLSLDGPGGSPLMFDLSILSLGSLGSLGAGKNPGLDGLDMGASGLRSDRQPRRTLKIRGVSVTTGIALNGAT